MRRSPSIILGLTLLAALLTACGGPATAATATAAVPSASATPDACAPENIKSAVSAVNQFMRQFDDESALASNVPRSQLALHIAALQSIRRDAQDQVVPPCLQRLKQLQLTDMNTVINTMMSFLGGADQQQVAGGIGSAQQQHDQYLLEIARLLGLTAVVVTRAPAVTPLPGSSQTPAATGSSATAVGQATAPSSTGLVAANPGPAAINLWAAPDNTAPVVATLAAGKSAAALGTTPDGSWIQVVVPDQPSLTAWVLATDVQVTYPSP